MFAKLPHDLQRVRLRPLRPADVAAFHAYRSDPEVARFQGWSPMTVAQASGFIQVHARHTALAPGAWHQLAIADRDSDALIGDAGVWLSPDGATAEIGLSIRGSDQGRGYGSESLQGLIGLLFSATSVVEILGNVDARNIACLAAMARSGMRHVATAQTTYKGEVCTELAFTIRKQADN